MTTSSPFKQWMHEVCGAAPEDKSTLLDRFRAELVDAARKDIGIRELAPNDGPQIRQWLADVGVGYPAPYCAAWTCAKIAQAAIACGIVGVVAETNDVIGPLPLEPSPAALRLAYNATQIGAFVRGLVLGWEPNEGDLLIWRRPTRDPKVQWTGHVAIVEAPGVASIMTIEANAPDQRGREGVVERTYDANKLAHDPKLLGFVDWSRVKLLGGKS
jgi:hypothetical protein